MLLLSLTIFILFLVLTILSGDSAHLYSDTAFPTIFTYIAIPAFLLALTTGKAREQESSPSQILRAIVSPASAPTIVASFYTRLGTFAVMLGVIVFLINLMSLVSNITPETFTSHFGIGLAHTLMSVLVGVVIKTISQAAAIRLS